MGEHKLKKPDGAPTTEAGRLAIRSEGEWVVAYFADNAHPTLIGALELQRIRAAFVPEGSPRAAAFLAISQDICTEIMRRSRVLRPGHAIEMRRPQ